MIESLECRALFAVTVDDTFTRPAALPTDGLDGDNVISNEGFIALLGDDRIVTGGVVFDNDLPARFLRAARFTADGAADTTFGGGDGLSPLIEVDNGSRIARGALQSDGKSIVAITTNEGFAVARFTADGAIDTSFGGGDGLATVDGFGSEENPVVNPLVAITTDGKIVVVGSKGPEPDIEENTQLYVARFNADGTLDTTFGNAGRVTIDPSEIKSDAVRARPHDLAAVAGGKVILLVELGITTDGNHQPALIQLDAAGDYDAAFSSDGRLPFEFHVGEESGDEAGALFVQNDGKVVVAGAYRIPAVPALTAITRFNANGTPDTSFGAGGISTVPPSTQREPYDLAVDRQGNFVLAHHSAISRFTPDGDVDPVFSDDGTEETGLQNILLAFDNENRAVAIGSGNVNRLLLGDDQRPEVALSPNGTLIITGELGSADNTITVAVSGDDVVVNRNGVSTTFDVFSVADLDIVTFAGDDTITVNFDRPAKVRVGDGANELTLGDGNHTVTGGDGADTITAGDGNHTVTARGGNDSVTLGAGETSVTGGDGNDSISTGAGNDEIFGEAGSDSISSGGGDDTVFGGAQPGEGFHFSFLTPGAAGESDGSNVLNGGDGNDLLVGAGSRDTLRGGAQRDTLVGFSGSDLLVGGGGNDKIAGVGGRDRIHGGAGDDQLDGGNGEDRLFGGDGDDKLFAGRGNDLLNGDADNDHLFAVDNAPDTLTGGDGEDDAQADNQDEVTEVETT